MISPRIKFEVGVRILGGLMALGYVVGAIMKRRSKEYSDDLLTIKVDWVEGLDRSFVQVQGRLRSAVEEAGKKLGLNGTYIAHSYIEQVQLEQLTKELSSLTDDLQGTLSRSPSRCSRPTPRRRTTSSDEVGSPHSANGRTVGVARRPGEATAVAGRRTLPVLAPPRPRTGAATVGRSGRRRSFYTPPPREASRGPSRNVQVRQAMDRMTSPSRQPPEPERETIVAERARATSTRKVWR